MLNKNINQKPVEQELVDIIQEDRSMFNGETNKGKLTQSLHTYILRWDILKIASSLGTYQIVMIILSQLLRNQYGLEYSQRVLKEHKDIHQTNGILLLLLLLLRGWTINVSLSVILSGHRDEPGV